ncbi:hypothetical protein ACHHYP_00662 [Achlya hypogyna]|uniref:Uncharacterized protein n=1 Tax=Achlya hypogyna TaxID=1202772 RepID=A0A1V9ZU29_ACHHY|nr:hypothetical protein ACHHYP_00662 [Achlya hypogyna]
MRRALSVPPRPRGLSPLQFVLYYAQTRHRMLNAWLIDIMPGLPEPPLTDEEKKAQDKEQLVDLWTLTADDHRRLFGEAWREYKTTWKRTKSDTDLQQALVAQTTKVQNAVNDHLATHNPELKRDMESWSASVQATLHEAHGQAKVHAAEMKVQAQALDVERIPDHVAEAVTDLRQRPVADVRKDMEAWVIDKLMVGRLTVMGFVQGYREGKEEELHRETPLLKQLAEQATEKHKDEIAARKAQFQRLVAEFEAKEKAKTRND